MTKQNILVLGGTVEARKIADLIEKERGLSAIYSLAGVTTDPILPSCRSNIGGFGGIAGLVDFIQENSIKAIVDATHPYAVKMSDSAVDVAEQTGVTLVRYQRAAWRPTEDDEWVDCSDVREAASSLPRDGSVVFLAIGKKEISAFKDNEHDCFLIRSVEPIEPSSLPSKAMVVNERGPFDLDKEKSLLQSNKVNFLVCKNSGGTASLAKLLACRDLGIKVFMIRRPSILPATTFGNVDDVLPALRAAFSS